MYVKASKSVLKTSSGPKLGLESDFETGQTARISPGVAADYSANRGDVDSGSSGNLSHPELVGDGTEVESELAGGLDDGVLAAAVGPALASVPGCGSGGSPHETTVAEHSNPALVSIDGGGTLSSDDVDWNHQSEVIDNLIENYTPHGMSAANWDAIEADVRAIVRKTNPQSFYGCMNMYAGIAYLAEWAWKRGQSLDPKELLDPANIDRFVATGCPGLSQGSRATRRAVLRTLHRRYFGTAQIGPKSAFPKTDSPMAPYTDEELGEFIFWAENQSSEVNTRAAHVMLGLSGGAGLASEDAISVKVGDVRRSKGLMVVTVHGRRPRQVPVRPDFEHFIIMGKKGLPKESKLLLPHRERSARSKAANFIKESVGDNKPSFQRLRITWLIYWLERGIPLAALIKAFGVTELHSISRYMKWLPEPSEAQMLDTFRSFS
jgi:site-specific recombinase XerD